MKPQSRSGIGKDLTTREWPRKGERAEGLKTPLRWCLDGMEIKRVLGISAYTPQILGYRVFQEDIYFSASVFYGGGAVVRKIFVDRQLFIFSKVHEP